MLMTSLDLEARYARSVSCQMWVVSDDEPSPMALRVLCVRMSRTLARLKNSHRLLFLSIFDVASVLFSFHFFCVFNFFISFCSLCSNSLDNPEIYDLRCYPPFAACISHSVKSNSASETAVFSFLNSERIEISHFSYTSPLVRREIKFLKKSNFFDTEWIGLAAAAVDEGRKCLTLTIVEKIGKKWLLRESIECHYAEPRRKKEKIKMKNWIKGSKEAWFMDPRLLHTHNISFLCCAKARRVLSERQQ